MMDDFTFTPSAEGQQRLRVPYLEEARADYAPYYRSKQTVVQAQDAVATELRKLDAAQIYFQEGYYKVGKDRRFGYAIHFRYGGMEGRIDVAGLPIRGTDTALKRQQVLVQALLVVRDQLKAQVTARVFSPQSDPLIGYLLVDGKRTVTQAAYESGRLPLLMPPAIEGEIVT